MNFPLRRTDRTSGEERDDYPALSIYAALYLDEDYDVISEDPDAIARVFKFMNVALRRNQLIEDIQKFVTKYEYLNAELGIKFDAVFSPHMAIYGWNGRTAYEALMRIIEIMQDPEELGFPRP